ncbi:hypothetical protein MHYP_G00109280 [Metynnis hypsauchen]
MPGWEENEKAKECTLPSRLFSLRHPPQQSPGTPGPKRIGEQTHNLTKARALKWGFVRGIAGRWLHCEFGCDGEKEGTGPVCQAANFDKSKSHSASMRGSKGKMLSTHPAHLKALAAALKLDVRSTLSQSCL